MVSGTVSSVCLCNTEVVCVPPMGGGHSWLAGTSASGSCVQWADGTGESLYTFQVLLFSYSYTLIGF